MSYGGMRLPPIPLSQPPFDVIHGVRVPVTYRLDVDGEGIRDGFDAVVVDGDRARVERQSWLTRVRDALNDCLVMVSACDLSRRTCGEVVAAERWATERGMKIRLPDTLRPFVRRHGETLLETRRRARRELREEGL